MKCDNCKQEYVMKGKGSKSFGQSVPTPTAPAPPAAPAQKAGDAREWDVQVPLQVSAITGGIISSLLLVATVPWRIAVGVGLFFMLIVWLIALGLFFWQRYHLTERLRWFIEEALDKDLDGDGHEGKPSGRTVINSRPKRAKSWRKVSAAGKVEDLVVFAKRVYELEQRGEPVGQKAMRGLELPSGFKASDSIHTALVRDLVDAGLAHFVGSGFKLDEVDTVHRLVFLVRQRVTAGV